MGYIDVDAMKRRQAAEAADAAKKKDHVAAKDTELDLLRKQNADLEVEKERLEMEKQRLEMEKRRLEVEKQRLEEANRHLEEKNRRLEEAHLKSRNANVRLRETNVGLREADGKQKKQIADLERRLLGSMFKKPGTVRAGNGSAPVPSSGTAGSKGGFRRTTGRKV